MSCTEELCCKISNILNLSLQSGVFPLHGQSGYFIRRRKSRNTQIIASNRGIAKLRSLLKLFEKIVIKQLVFAINTSTAPFQHAFLKGRLTGTNLLEFSTACSCALKTDAVYMHFSMAFDRVNHKVLLFKLQLSGFPTYLLNWIFSYLQNRSLRLKCNSVPSNDFPVTTVVPQGSHLGLFLFILYINNLPLVIKTICILMYVDKVKLFSSVKMVCDLQFDLENLATW